MCRRASDGSGELRHDGDRSEVGPLLTLCGEGMSKCSSSTTVLRSVSSFLTQSVPWDKGMLRRRYVQGVPRYEAIPATQQRRTTDSTQCTTKTSPRQPCTRRCPTRGDLRERPLTAAKYPGHLAGAAITVRMVCLRISTTRSSRRASCNNSSGSRPCNRAVSIYMQAAYPHRLSAEHGQ